MSNSNSIINYFNKERCIKRRLIIEEDEENVAYSHLIHPYKNNEYIPDNIIHDLINIMFKSNVILHEYNIRHIVIKVTIRDMLNCNIFNWKYNRPPDEKRCYDIARHIYFNKTPIDNILYLNYNNIKKGFDTIDGIHRLNALKIIQKYNNQPIDLITPSEFGNNNDAIWLYDSYILLNIRFNTTESTLIEVFKNINKSIPIPELYLRDTTNEKKEIIEKIANEWQVMFRPHFSSSISPKKPNINRDRFIDFLEVLYDKYKISYENKYKLEDLLFSVNNQILYNIPKKITNNIKEKCSETGCYLFMYSTDELLNKYFK